MTPDPYAVLGVDPGAGPDELRRAWIAAARQHHPDRGGDPARMREVNEAWAVLSDPAARRRLEADRPGARRADERFDAPLPEDDGSPPQGTYVVPAGRALPPGLALVPPGLFLGSIAVGSFSLVSNSPGVLGAAVVLFSLSCLAVAVVALLSLRRR